MARPSDWQELENITNDELLKEAGRFSGILRKKIAGGVTVRKAVTSAWAEAGMSRKLTNGMTDALVIAGEIGNGRQYAKLQEASEFYLNDFFDEQGLNLSSKIVKNAKRSQRLIATEINNQFKANAAWQKVARGVDNTKLIKGDIAKDIKELGRLGKRNLSAVDAKKFNRLLLRTEKRVFNLAQAGAPTTRLKKAYANVLKAVKTGSKKAIDRSIDRVVKAKARYNAERIARTEMARSWGDGFQRQLDEDPDAIGWKSELSSNHPKYDVCDLHAKANLHGIGPGGYPKHSGPPYGYHPHCRCLKRPLYSGQAQIQVDNAKGQKYIDSLSKQDRQNLMGKQGSEIYAKNPKSWPKLVNNYQPEKVINVQCDVLELGKTVPELKNWRKNTSAEKTEYIVKRKKQIPG